MAYELAASGDVMQIGYGGEPHGGKTDLTLGLAGTLFPDAKIFRRTFTQLKKIMKRGNEIYPAQYVSGKQIAGWRWDNHFIELSHMQHEKNWEDHQGQASSFIGIDEAAQFTEFMVRMIGGWLRTVDVNQHTLLFLTFNPPTTPEGEWIVQFFAPWLDPEYPGEQAQPGEIRWFVHVDGRDIEVEDGEPYDNNGQILYPVSRTFIRARRWDNPYHNAAYEQTLSALPEPLRTKMMEGDFTIGMQDDAWQVIPTNWILAAQERHCNGEKPDVNIRAVGVDVAHGGADDTVIAKLYGTWFDELLVSDTPTGQIAAHHVIQSIGDEKPPIYVDAIGYGASCSDALRDMPGIRANAVNVGKASDAHDKSGVYQFANLRAQLFWQLREALDPESGEDIALPDDRQLRVELSAMRYKIQSGKIRIEPKEDIKKRLGYSPDRADAVALAWYGCNQPAFDFDFI
jgi:hypothetical protein